MKNIIFVSILLGLVSINFSQAQIYWSEKWDGGNGQNWNSSGNISVWQIGTPAPGAGPSSIFEGDSCAGTNLSGNYPSSGNSRLESPSIVVPNASENPRLRFWHWYNFNYSDFGKVQLNVNGSWIDLTNNYTWTGSNVWTAPLIDLTPYAGDTVQIGFFFNAQNNSGISGTDVSTGWYIDKIEIVTGAYTFDIVNNPETFESGLGDWSSERGTWQVGIKDNGGFGFESQTSAGTQINGDYASTVTSRLVSPPFVVPDASENPRLRFWQWYSFNYSDFGKVQLKVNGNWIDLTGNYTWSGSGVWTSPLVDLASYAGDTVRLGFYFEARNNSGISGSDIAWGWNIDDVEIVTGAYTFDIVNNPETFESGLGDWSSERGTWQVGIKDNGGFGFESQTSAGTQINGDYASTVTSRLVSPPFVIPDASENPRLRFWQWYSFNYSDFGKVQLKVNGNWIDLTGNYTWSGSGVWTSPLVDLASYAGDTVRLGFYFEARNNSGISGSDIAWGWNIDDVEIVTGAFTFDIVNNPETFESGLGDWSSERGTWQVGIKDNGGFGFESQTSAGTQINGDYASTVTSRLVSPPFVIPDASENPRLRFWQWYSFNYSDFGKVQLKVNGNWIDLTGNYTWSGSGVWTSPLVDLASYAGDTVRLGFYFEARNNSGISGSDIAWGWNIDDVEIVTGAYTFDIVNNPETFESGLGDWSSERGTWQVGIKDNGGFGFESQTSAGTQINGNYASTVTSRLVSPPFVVPDASENPRLRFWQWYSFNYSDFGKVQLKVNGNWVNLTSNYTWSGSGVWTSPLVDLTAYAGDTVQLGFYFEARNNSGISGSDIAWGWNIDDVEIVTGDYFLDKPEIFHSGLGDWSAERGTWEVGVPMSGPGNAFNGDTCAATVLRGNYGSTVTSNLVSPPFEVPDSSQNPRIRFRHWYNFSHSDYGEVLLKVDSSGWQTILGPYTGNSSENWRRPFFDLAPYVGKTIQVAFKFVARNNSGISGSDVSSGWYIDEFFAQELPVLPPQEVSIVKSATATVPGRKVTYFIQVENVGDVIALDVPVSEFLEPWFTYESANPNPDTILKLPDFFPNPLVSDLHDGILNWNISHLIPGDFTNISYEVALDPSVPIGSIVTGGACLVEVDVDCYNDVYRPCMDALQEACKEEWGPLFENLCSQIIGQGTPSCLSAYLGCLGITTPFNWICDLLDEPTIQPIDPNEKVVLAETYIQPDKILTYPIHFENEGTIEALDIFINDTLDQNLDLSTLQILTPNGSSVDTINRSIRWELLNRNLQPGETDNVLLSIKPLPNLPSGTIIRNKADIQFEIFDVFFTNEVVNIIDAEPPSSRIDSLPETINQVDFPVSWSGTDSIGEIDHYTIFVSKDEGYFQRLFTQTRDTVAIFTGEPGSTYSFVSIAQDVAGNIEIKDPFPEETIHILSTATSIDSPLDPLEKKNQLLQNYPNPFGQKTTIPYYLFENGDVEIVIYNAIGQKVRLLVNQEKIPGYHTVEWDGKDDMGIEVSKGLYFYSLIFNDLFQTRRMLKYQY